MDRPDATLIPKGTPWLTDTGAVAVCRAIVAGGHRIYFVGGCVRNALLGVSVSDIDLATDAMPEKVMTLVAAAGMKVIPTGIDHGTVTVVRDGMAYEITTFRRDVQTDGRRAVVVFSTDISDDARRRDFTINALYVTPEGQVVDPLGGLDDLWARRIRFIDDAVARIREDYLRVLRYFRFHAWYGNPEDGFDEDALAAIGANLAGLETLSAERVGAEMQKLLKAVDPVFALSGMQGTGVLSQILPGADTRLIALIIHFERILATEPDWITRLAALGGDDPGLRWRLSKADARKLTAIREAAFDGPSLAEVAYRDGYAIAVGAALLRGAIAETLPDLAPLVAASQAGFPVTAHDLMPAFTGPALGRRLGELEQVWIDSGFSLTREELLQ